MDSHKRKLDDIEKSVIDSDIGKLLIKKNKSEDASEEVPDEVDEKTTDHKESSEMIAGQEVIPKKEESSEMIAGQEVIPKNEESSEKIAGQEVIPKNEESSEMIAGQELMNEKKEDDSVEKTGENKEMESKDTSRNHQRIMKELHDIQKDPPANFTISLRDDNIYEWQATMNGPPGTPYEGGKFILHITLDHYYPRYEPHVVFRTKIYHHGISSKGRLCCLAREWSSKETISTWLTLIHQLIAKHIPNRSLRYDIKHQYLHNRQKHDHTAWEWTRRYARNEQSSFHQIPPN